MEGLDKILERKDTDICGAQINNSTGIVEYVALIFISVISQQPELTFFAQQERSLVAMGPQWCLHNCQYSRLCW